MNEERIIGKHLKTILNLEKDLFLSQPIQMSQIDFISLINEDHLWLWININQKSVQTQIREKPNTQTYHLDFTNQRNQCNLLHRKIENQQFKDQENDRKIENKKLKRPLIVFTAQDPLIRNFQKKFYQNRLQNQILWIIMKKVSKKKKTSLNNLQMKFKRLILD